jgi:hypothetical protein
VRGRFHSHFQQPEIEIEPILARNESSSAIIRYIRKNQRKTLDHHPNHSLHNGIVIPKALATNALRRMRFRAENIVLRKCNRCKELTL